MKKLLTTLSILGIIAMFAATSFAWGPGSGTGSGKGQRGTGNCPGYQQKGGVYASLTAEQQEQLRQLRQKFIDETVEIRLAKHQKRDEMRLLMQTSNPDRQRLVDLSDSIADLEKQLGEKRIDFALAAKKISPELGSYFGKGKRHSRNGYGKGSGQGQGYGQGQNCPRF